MSRRAACHKSSSRRLSPVTARYMRSLSISLRKLTKAGRRGTSMCTDWSRQPPAAPATCATGCHQLPAPRPHLHPRTLCYPRCPIETPHGLLRFSSAIAPTSHALPPHRRRSGLLRPKAPASLRPGIASASCVIVLHHRPPLPPLRALPAQRPDLAPLPP